MNKTAACIKLIQVLAARGGYVSTKELAEMLETNPRNIREYIKEIEICGYTVYAMKGIYGGYKLDKSEILPSISLLPNEKQVILKSVEFLSNCNDFLDYKEYYNAIGKVLCTTTNQNEITPLTMIDRFPLAMDKNQLEIRYQVLNDCIENQIKCEISYLSSKTSKAKMHVLHPYKLFTYNGGWFVLAFNETINDFGYFKLNRIETIYKGKNHFTLMKTFEESKYLDSFGFKKNGEYYDITLEFTGLNNVIGERIYGKEQSIEVIDDNHTHLKCKMQNKDMIKSFVLSFGRKCRVISPDWLKKDVEDEITELLGMY